MDSKEKIMTADANNNKILRIFNNIQQQIMSVHISRSKFTCLDYFTLKQFSLLQELKYTLKQIENFVNIYNLYQPYSFQSTLKPFKQ